MGKILFISDVYDMRRRKQAELKFYHAELEKLKLRMELVQSEIEVTNLITTVIEHEEVIDIRQAIKKMID